MFKRVIGYVVCHVIQCQFIHAHPSNSRNRYQINTRPILRKF